MAHEMLNKVSIFDGLDEQELEVVSGICKEETYESGQPIFGKGDDADAMFVVLGGKADVFIQPPGFEEALSVNTMASGDFFGEISFLDQQPRSATIRCSEETNVLRIGFTDLNAVMEKYPRIGMVMSRNLGSLAAARLRKSDGELTRYFNENKGFLIKDRISTFYSRLRG